MSKKSYFLEIVKDGKVVEVAGTQADSQELANAAITNAALGRGFVNFSVRETTEEAFLKFKNEKAQEAGNSAAAESGSGRVAPPIPGTEDGGKGVDPNPATGGTADDSPSSAGQSLEGATVNDAQTGEPLGTVGKEAATAEGTEENNESAAAAEQPADGTAEGQAVTEEKAAAAA
jgi:hypothetical protein